MTTKVSALALVSKEARIGARSRRTYVLRFIYALGLLVVACPVLLKTRHSVSQLADAGRDLFLAFAHAQLYLLALLAPLAVASTFCDEKEEHTAGLLLLTRLGARRIVLGKMLAQLLSVELLFAAGLPVLAMALVMGGVSMGEVLGAMAITQVTLLGVVALATLAGIVFDGAIAAVIACYVFYFIFWLLLPFVALLISFTQRHSRPWFFLSPLYALTFSTAAGRISSAWSIVGPLLWLGPLAVVAAIASPPAFELFSSDDPLPDGGEASGATAAELLGARFRGSIERLWQVGRWFITAVILSLPVAALINASLPHSKKIFAIYFSLMGVPVALAGALFYLRLCLGAAIRSRAKKRRSIETMEEILRPPDQRLVWDDPVLWREWCTRAYGSLAALMRGINITIVVGVAIAALTPGFYKWGSLRAFLGTLIYSCAAIMLVLLASATFVVEKRERTLYLLALSTFAPARIVLAKLLALGRYLALPLGLAAVLMLTGYDDREVLGRTLWLYAYLVFVAGVAFYVSLRSQRQVGALGLSLLWALLPILVVAIAGGLLGAKGEIVALLLPMLGPSHDEPFVSSSLLYGLVAAVLLLRTAIELRARSASSPN